MVMEFHTAREVALYDMLKQMLCHYMVTQRLAYHQALAACVPALGFQLWITQQWSHTHMPLPAFADYRASPEDPPAR
jgi:hypothetical protein